MQVLFLQLCQMLAILNNSLLNSGMTFRRSCITKLNLLQNSLAETVFNYTTLQQSY